MLEPRPINDDVFLEERKKTNQYENKKVSQTIYWNTPLTSVECHFKFSKSRNSSVTQDKQGAKAF